LRIRERSRALPAINQHVPTDEREEQQQVRADDGYAQRERRFRQLYEEHYLHIQAYAVRRLDVQADVADVVAEVFTTAWRRLDDIPPAPEARLWLYGVARRVLAGHRRGKERFRRLVARIEASHVAAPQPALGDPDGRVTRVLRQIPPGEREALMLVAWEQLSYAEAAQVLGCSPNAIGIRVHRARMRMREAFGQPPPETAVRDMPMPARTGGNHGR
jgi:RNA polymerase sigma factor (sigma-70 family)